MSYGTYVEMTLTESSEETLRSNLAAMQLPLSKHPYHCTTVYSKTPITYPGIASRYINEAQPKRLWEVHPNTMAFMFLAGHLVLITRTVATLLSHAIGKRAGAIWDFPEYIPHITLVYNIEVTQLNGQKLWTPRNPLVFEKENIYDLDETGKVIREAA